MQTDKELLELAAKAAGINVGYSIDGDAEEVLVFFDSDDEHHQQIDWNPDTDDGDSRRLQVALKIDLVWDCFDKLWEAIFYDGDTSEYSQLHKDPDPKRAVLLVAAAIGEAIIKEGV